MNEITPIAPENQDVLGALFSGELMDDANLCQGEFHDETLCQLPTEDVLHEQVATGEQPPAASTVHDVGVFGAAWHTLD